MHKRTITSLLKDFRPYQWYDISCFPTSYVPRNGIGPICSVIVKWWSPENDKFLIRKVPNARYHQGTYDDDDDLPGWRGIDLNERVIAFMWDGEDVPLTETLMEDNMPVLRDRPISREFGTKYYINNSTGELVAQTSMGDDTGLNVLGEEIITQPNKKWIVCGLNKLDPKNPIVYVRSNDPEPAPKQTIFIDEEDGAELWRTSFTGTVAMNSLHRHPISGEEWQVIAHNNIADPTRYTVTVQQVKAD